MVPARNETAETTPLEEHVRKIERELLLIGSSRGPKKVDRPKMSRGAHISFLKLERERLLIRITSEKRGGSKELARRLFL